LHLVLESAQVNRSNQLRWNMNFLKTLFGGVPENGVLTVIIRVDDDFRFHLFTKIGVGFSDIEHAQLFLNYYLRTLINLKSSPAANILRTNFEKVFLEGFKKNSNILKSADIDDVVLIQATPLRNAREYVATITLVDAHLRSCYIKLPQNGYEQDMVFSVFVMLQNLVEILDEFHIELLLEAGTKLIFGMSNDGELSRGGVDFKTALGSRLLVAASIVAATASMKEKSSAKKGGNYYSVINSSQAEDNLDRIRSKQNSRRISAQNSILRNDNVAKVGLQILPIGEPLKDSNLMRPTLQSSGEIEKQFEESDKVRVRQLMREANLLSTNGIGSLLDKGQLLKWTKKTNPIEAYFMAAYIGIPHIPPDFSDPALNLKLEYWLKYAKK
jgi:hypothetical protein